MPEAKQIADTITEKGNAVFDVISTVDTASSKFQKRNRKGSIAKAAKGNLFEFPVFVSKSVALDYATATTSLLEQVYASYLQQAISRNPIVDADQVRRGLQFADYKTDTNKYLEYTEMDYAHDACYNEIPHEDGKYMMEFSMLSIEDSEAIDINESYNYEPLSEFSHFFQEAKYKNKNKGNNGNTNNTNNNTNNGNNGNNKNNNSQNIQTYNDNITKIIDKINENARLAKSTASPEAGKNIDKDASAVIKQIAKSYKIDLNKPLTPADVDRIVNRNMPPDRINTYDPNQYSKDNKNKLIESANEAKKKIANDTLKDKDPDAYKRAKDSYDKLIADIETGRIKVDGGTAYGDTEADNIIKNILPEDTDWKSLDASKEVKDSANAKIDFLNALTTAKDAKIKEPGLTEDEVAVINARYYAAAQNAISKITPEEFGKLKPDQQKDIAKIVLEPNRFEKEPTESRIKKTADAIETGLKITDSAVGITTKIIGAVDSHKKSKLEREMLKRQLEDYDEEKKNKAERLDLERRTTAAKELEAEIKRREFNKVKAPTMLKEGDITKLNTMKPLMMQVELAIMDKNDTISRPIEYVVGVKCFMRLVDPDILPEVAEYPLKEMNKLTRKVKWRAGELKFFKDIVFNIKQKKQTAADSRDPKRKWYRRLYNLAHMQGDAPSTAVIQGKSITGALINEKLGKSKLNRGAMPNATIIISQSDVDNIKAQTDIDLLSASSASKFCNELFLLSLIVIDDDADTIKMLVPALHNDYEIHTLASVKKQLATLDTVGTKTRDMFKVLGA